MTPKTKAKTKTKAKAKTSALDASSVEVEKLYFQVLLGHVLREERTLSSKSMRDIANVAGVAEATISRYESGSRIDPGDLTAKNIKTMSSNSRMPDVFTAFKISKALGITVDELMNRCITMALNLKMEYEGHDEEIK